VSNVRINFVVIEEKVEQILRGWETTAPEQSFADMTLEQFKQALQPYFAAKAAEDAIAQLEKVDPNAEDLPNFRNKLASLKAAK